MCCTGKFNMSYKSLTGYEARQKLCDLKETDPKFWDQLTQRAAPDVDIPANKCITKDKDATDLDWPGSGPVQVRWPPA